VAGQGSWVRVRPIVVRLVTALIAAQAAIACSAQAATVPSTLSESGLLKRLADPSGQLTPLPAGTRVIQVSSHDLTGGNLDGGSYDALPANPLRPPTFVRKEGGAFVIADLLGPGCLARIWMTAGSPTQGDPSSFGNLQLLFDGADRPAVDVPAADFFGGKDSRFPAPLVGDHHVSSGGNYSYIPFCFARRLVVRATGSLSDSSNYFQMTFLRAPGGTATTTFDGNGAAAAASAASSLAHPGQAPATPPFSTVSTQVHPGELVSLGRLTGAGTVRYLRFAVTPFDAATLHDLSLRVAVDGAATPQIDVPLADLFGDGLEVRPIRSLAFGMTPADNTGYFALPVPYARGARISLLSNADAHVSLTLWKGAPVRTHSRLYGQRLVTQTQLGQDFPVLQAGGSGRLVSYVMDVLDPGAPGSGFSGGQWFMEGTERVYVDGSRSPSIYGTGTEDIFNGGYYFNGGPFTLPLTGAGPLGSTGTEGGTQSAYRVYVNDGAIWSSGLDFGQQAGGGNERLPETAQATTFSYRAPVRLRLADALTFGSPGNEQAHSLTGAFSRVTLDAYFEGKHDGNLPVSTIVIGGSVYPAAPPQASSESFSAAGIAFSTPISLTLKTSATNNGVVLRRLLDQSTPAPVGVSVDGQPAGTWTGPAFQGNPSKQWLEDDYDLPSALTAGKSSLRITLTPTNSVTATAYELQALTRSD
jgi:hypothetical protein